MVQKSRSEANILNDCLIAISKNGGTAWRNNTGVLTDKNGRPVKFGLCVGSSDIVGICPDGVFLAVECKTATGKVSEKQAHFLDSVKAKGGRAGVARCADDAIDIMKGDT